MKKLQLYVLTAIVTLTPLSFSNAYADTAAEKFTRGLAGVSCGFLEIPGNIAKETQDRGWVGAPLGLVTGMGKMVSRELVGAYEIISAPFPIPADFAPILTPQYPWDYFE